MRPAERRWLAGFVLLTLLLTGIPYLLGYWVQGEDWQFTGFVFGADDGNSYIAKMMRGASGDWLFRSPYTAYPQNGLLAFAPYILLGKLSAPPAQHEQLVWLFQLFRWLGVFVMAAGTYRFLSFFFTGPRLRRFGTALAVLGGGLGWLYAFGAGGLWGSRLPLEYYSPESFGFLSLLGLPHLAFSRGLLLLGMLAFLQAVTTASARPAVLCGLLWLLMGFFQPLSIVTGWAVLGVAFLLNAAIQLYRRRAQNMPLDLWFRPLLLVGLISAPPVIYNLVVSLTDPFMRSWSQQNIISSPPLLDYLLAYGSLLLLAIPGLRALSRKNQPGAVLLLAWLVAFPFLAYAPHPVQRRLPEGIWVALVVLALAGFEQIRAYKWRAALRAVSLTAFLPAVILLAGALFSLRLPAAPLFIPAQQVLAYQYLDQHAARDSIVLADFEVSNALPAWAPVFTLTGHGPESIHAAEVQPAVQQFFDPRTPDAARLALLRRFQVDYVLAGPRDAWQPGQAGYLTSVFETPSVTVYQVVPPPP